MSIDLKTLEEVVERAVKRALEEARSSEMRAVAEALKAWRTTPGQASPS